jgi:hypothetical protein
MSNLVYNPNVDIPPYHGFGDNDGPRAMDFPSDGNFKTQVRDNFDYNKIDYVPQEPARPQRDYIYDAQEPPRRAARKPKVVETFDETTKFNWILFFKKLFIYAILFLLISHIKMNQLTCTIMPFLQSSELALMTVKGLILGLIIIILQLFL